MGSVYGVSVNPGETVFERGANRLLLTSALGTSIACLSACLSPVDVLGRTELRDAYFGDGFIGETLALSIKCLISKIKFK